MARDRDQRHGRGRRFAAGAWAGRVLERRQRLPELPRHILDETGLSRARRALEQYRYMLAVRRSEDVYLVAARNIERLIPDNVIFDAILAEFHAGWHYSRASWQSATMVKIYPCTKRMEPRRPLRNSQKPIVKPFNRVLSIDRLTRNQSDDNLAFNFLRDD